MVRWQRLWLGKGTIVSNDAERTVTRMLEEFNEQRFTDFCAPYRQG